MGRAIVSAAADVQNCRIVAGVDINTDAVAPVYDFPVYQTIEEFPGKSDVIIDFSHHTALPSLLAYAKASGTALVVATTGQTAEELEIIAEASEEVAIFRSANMSIGVAVLDDRHCIRHFG